MITDRASPPSPYQRYLGTNYPLPEIAVDGILAYLYGPLRELASVKHQIQILLAKQAELEGIIHAHEALVHPIRKVPQEVLQLIFFACLPTTHYPTMGMMDPPLVLTQVCRLWRSLALDTPQLWASIHIVAAPVEIFGINEARSRIEGVEQWLERSKTLPLSLSIYGPCNYEPRHDVDYELSLAVCRHASRVRVIEFNMSDQLLGEFIDAQAGHCGPWSSLEGIKIDMNLKDEGGHDLTSSGSWVSSCNSTIFAAPNLRSLALLNVDDSVLHLSLQWDQIEKLRVGGLCHGSLIGHVPRDVRRLLQATPNLAHLQIVLEGGFDTIDSDSHLGISAPLEGEITHSHLVDLDLMDIFIDPWLDEEHADFLSNLQLPSLQSLTYDLRVVTVAPSLDEEPLPKFLSAQHSPVLITSFTIRLTSIYEENMVKCLKLMPLLEHLSIQRPEFPVNETDMDRNAISTAFFAYLHDQGTQSICPRLSTICVDPSNISLGDLRVSLESRAMLSGPHTETPFTRLRRVHVVLVEKRPTFVPRDPGRTVDGKPLELAQCSLEEELRDSGVDAKICLRDQAQDPRSIPYNYPPFNPRLGIRTDS